MKKYAIIVAGGSGTRMKAKVPKQFMIVAGKPVLMHTIERFHTADPSTYIIVVLPDFKVSLDKWKLLVNKYSKTKFIYSLVPGGDTRFESVKNGLAVVCEKSVVAVHDGVRPLASKKLINKCFAEAEKNGSAVPVISVNDSLRMIKGKKNSVVDRNDYVAIQTPQCFSSEILLKAYEQPYKKSFTDDASVVESLGKKIHLVEGERENIKITYPADLKIAKVYLKK